MTSPISNDMGDKVENCFSKPNSACIITTIVLQLVPSIPSKKERCN